MKIVRVKTHFPTSSFVADTKRRIIRLAIIKCVREIFIETREEGISTWKFLKILLIILKFLLFLSRVLFVAKSHQFLLLSREFEYFWWIEKNVILLLPFIFHSLGIQVVFVSLSRARTRFYELCDSEWKRANEFTVKAERECEPIIVIIICFCVILSLEREEGGGSERKIYTFK